MFTRTLLSSTSVSRFPRFSRHFNSSLPSNHGSKVLPFSIAILSLAGAGYYFTTTRDNTPTLHKVIDKNDTFLSAIRHDTPKEPLDYRKVANAIANLLDNNDYDDGSYGPLFVRLAWHASGTYSKHDGTGGSNGATMRYNPESTDGANNGLDIARNLLEPIKQQFPDISYADLWTLAGVVAIKELGGPSITWRSGRTDAISAHSGPPVGRLPDASKDRKHIREVFYRMGFDDREIVALIGAHALGRCHKNRSGFSGPWTFSPITFTNEFFKLLINESWVKKNWDGPLQYEDKKTRTLMMLPTGMEIYNDRTFYKYAKEFANDENVYFQAFSDAFKKLIELGVTFPENCETVTL